MALSLGPGPEHNVLQCFQSFWVRPENVGAKVLSPKCPRSVPEVFQKWPKSVPQMSQKRPRSVAKVRGDAEKDAKEHDMNTEHDFPGIEEP